MGDRPEVALGERLVRPPRGRVAVEHRAERCGRSAPDDAHHDYEDDPDHGQDPSGNGRAPGGEPDTESHEQDAGQGEQEEDQADADAAGDLLTPALPEERRGALQRGEGPETLRCDHRNGEKGDERPRSAAESGEDRAGEPAAASQEHEQEVDDCADDRPAEDRPEPGECEPNSLADGGVLSVEDPADRVHDRDAEEDGHRVAEVEAEAEEHPGDRGGLVPFADHSCGEQGGQRNQRCEDEAEDDQRDQGRIAANDRQAFLGETPAATEALHCASVLARLLSPTLSGGMTKRTILLIEDEEAISEPLAAALSREGFDTVVAGTAESGLELFDKRAPDLVLLDVMLPDGDGRDVLRRIRETSRTPVVMLTARGEEMDRVLGLELGADDYVTKPFSAAELAARVRAVLRRTGETAAPSEAVLEAGDVRMDLDTHEATLAGEPLELTVKEFDLLRVLLEHAGKLVKRNDLVHEVWDPAWFGSTKTLDVHISALRKKLGDDPAAPRYIHTVRGVGFRFEAP